MLKWMVTAGLLFSVGLSHAGVLARLRHWGQPPAPSKPVAAVRYLAASELGQLKAETEPHSAALADQARPRQELSTEAAQALWASMLALELSVDPVP